MVELKEAWACFTALGTPQSISAERWGMSKGSVVPGAQWRQHGALTRLAVLPGVAHGARAHKVPAEVLAGRTVLTWAQKARRWHWKEQRALAWSWQGPKPLPLPLSTSPKWFGGEIQQHSAAHLLPKLQCCSPPTLQHPHVPISQCRPA